MLDDRRIVDRLEAKKLVRRAVSKRDLRRKQLLLTSVGKALLEEVGPKAERVHDRLLARIAPEEYIAFIATLRRILGIDEHTHIPAVETDDEVA